VFTSGATRAYAAGPEQPIAGSVAVSRIGTRQYLFFAGGSDLLPQAGAGAASRLFGLLDGQHVPSFTFGLERDGLTGRAERAVSAPVVAGDVVFFGTTTVDPATPCGRPDAQLYAFTFTGGVAYDSSGDGRVSETESPRVWSGRSRGRATAPFVADRHLWFGAGSRVSVFGDPQDFNTGVGRRGVRILSWRQVR
jgi:hypothetical protein